MEEPVFVKCESAWPADREETCNFEEKAVQISDNQVKIKGDPHAAIADLSLEETAVNIKDEIFIEENNVEDFVQLTEGPVLSSDDGSQTFNQKTRMYQPLTQTAEGLYVPSLCTSTLPQARGVKEEVLTPSREMRDVCKLCSECFSEKELIHEHMSTHLRPHKCEVCSKSFARKWTKKQHMLSHSTEKSFCCNICNKKYKTKDSLRNHSITHTGEMPFFCEVCGKKFQYRRYLVAHSVSHSSAKPHKCTVCKVGFARNYGLKSHMTVHYVVRQYCCGVCGKKFEHRSNLLVHAVTHSSGESLYCEV